MAPVLCFETKSLILAFVPKDLPSRKIVQKLFDHEIAVSTSPANTLIKDAKREVAGILISEKKREAADSAESSHGMPNHSSEESYNCTYSFESKSFWKEDEGLPVFSSLNSTR